MLRSMEVAHALRGTGGSHEKDGVRAFPSFRLQLTADDLLSGTFVLRVSYLKHVNDQVKRRSQRWAGLSVH
jgi:hypothetical protein